jgi:hypothetical protein
MSINLITIAHEVSRRGFFRKGLHDLMRRPIGRWILRHVEVQNAAALRYADFFEVCLRKSDSSITSQSNLLFAALEFLAGVMWILMEIADRHE